MSRNTYRNSRLYLGKREILTFSSVSFKNSGKNQVTTLTVKIDDPELDGAALLGQELVFFLNNGSDDSVPLFRGHIRQYAPSDKNLTLTAHDVLSFLSGAESPPLNITDKINYDGFTLGQMLTDYIKTYVNKSKTVIGLDMINDTNPPITMTGFRKNNITPLKVIQQLIKTNDSSLTDIKNTRLVVRDDGVKSNICFVEEQDINSAGMKFSFNDGIEKLNYKRRPAPNFYSTFADGNKMTYQHNTLPTGIVMGKLKGKFEYPDKAKEQAFIDATANEDKKEITITVNKGYELDIGNVIVLQTPEHPELTGKHRIISKNLTAGKSMKCTLGLNKEAPQISDYMSSSS
tara:strand:+ start:989 stop:2026 length:1038 start_codon:yes stop_codon:yes gene_type:complete